MVREFSLIETIDSKCEPPSNRSFNTKMWDSSDEFSPTASATFTEEDADISVPSIDVALTPLLSVF